MAAYEQGRFAEAEGHFIAAALAGDPRAQEILGVMYTLGSALYPGVARNPVAAAQWLERAAQNGRAVARHLYSALARRDRLRPLTGLAEAAWNRS